MERYEKIMEGVHDHFEEALQYFPKDNIVGIFLQGSQNYGLDTENSDIDTKLIVTPTWEDICFNRKPVSTTYHRENDEHIDLKDIRLYIQTFRKQNLNFVEILFTKYKIINPRYANSWNRLVENREAIARYNPAGAVKTMKGIALEKFHAMEHRYPSKIDIIDRYGYDPKQLHHLRRVDEFLSRYIAGVKYENCLTSLIAEDLKREKMKARPLEEAREAAIFYKNHVEQMHDAFIAENEMTADAAVDELLDSVQCEIMEKAIYRELNDKYMEKMIEALERRGVI